MIGVYCSVQRGVFTTVLEGCAFKQFLRGVHSQFEQGVCIHNLNKECASKISQRVIPRYLDTKSLGDAENLVRFQKKVGGKMEKWDVRSQNKRRKNRRNKKAKKMLDTQIREKMRIAYTTTKHPKLHPNKR